MPKVFHRDFVTLRQLGRTNEHIIGDSTTFKERRDRERRILYLTYEPGQHELPR